MTDSLLAIILIPIVVAVCLAFWIFAVYHADRHPRTGSGDTRDMPQRRVTGGTFRARSGRQVMPSRLAPADADEEEDQVARTPEETGAAAEEKSHRGGRAADEAAAQAGWYARHRSGL